MDLWPPSTSRYIPSAYAKADFSSPNDVAVFMHLRTVTACPINEVRGIKLRLNPSLAFPSLLVWNTLDF